MPERLPKDLEDWLVKLAKKDFRGNRLQESADAEKFVEKYCTPAKPKQFCRCSHSADIHVFAERNFCRVPGCGCREFRA